MKKTIYERFFKRFFDFTLSLIAIIILFIPFLIVMLFTRIFNGKGVFFVQPRPGKNGKIFKLIKFRSMSNKKDKNGNLLPDSQRVTKWGKFLRKTSLDELPQLFNILKGDMSIVGPRPRLVKDMVFYPEIYFASYSVRPGLTGMTQANGRNSNTWEQVLILDKKYTEKITFFGDLKLILKTFTSIFVSKGSSDGSAENHQAYYYADYLLESNQITEDTYKLGIDIAQKMIENDLKVTFQPQLTRIEKEQVKEVAEEKTQIDA